MHKVLLYGISANVSVILQRGNYVAINTAVTTTMGYYVVKLLSEPCTLQDNKTVDEQVIKAGEHMVKQEYLSITKTDTNCYWQPLENKDSVIIVTHTIVHLCLSVSNIVNVSDIRISLCNKKQAWKDIQIHPIHVSDADTDYILDEIKRRNQIEYERNLHYGE